MDEPFNLGAYLTRIGYQGPPATSITTLQQLHLLHPESIAFENLSSFLGQEVNIDIASIQDKLIANKRGGYCYEQNLLFMHALTQLGFSVTGLLATVKWNVPPGLILPRSHMTMLVHFEGERYLADVGFGGMTLTAPLRLDIKDEQLTPHGTFRVEQKDNEYTIFARINSEWKPMYSFGLQAQNQADYDVANWYVSTHPKSRFVRELIITRPTKNARLTLLNNRFSIHYGSGESEKHTIYDVAELVDTITKHFDLPVEDIINKEVERKFVSILHPD